jgi:hypothetical protein
MPIFKSRLDELETFLKSREATNCRAVTAFLLLATVAIVLLAKAWHRCIAWVKALPRTAVYELIAVATVTAAFAAIGSFIRSACGEEAGAFIKAIRDCKGGDTFSNACRLARRVSEPAEHDDAPPAVPPASPARRTSRTSPAEFTRCRD